MDAAVNQVAMFPEDERAYNGAVETAKSVAESMKSHHGWSDEQTQDYITKQLSPAVAARVKDYADRGQITEAQSILDEAKSKGHIVGTTAMGADGHIRYQRNEITRSEEHMSELQSH